MSTAQSNRDFTSQQQVTPERIMQIVGDCPPLIMRAQSVIVFDVVVSAERSGRYVKKPEQMFVQHALWWCVGCLNLLTKTSQALPRHRRALCSRSSKPSFTGGIFRHVSISWSPFLVCLRLACRKPADAVNKEALEQSFQRLVEDLSP